MQALVFVSASVGGSAVKLSTASAFNVSAANLLLAQRVIVTCDTNTVRYTYDGVTAPTASVGHLIPTSANPPVEIFGNGNINNLQIIATTGSAVVQVTLEGI